MKKLLLLVVIVVIILSVSVFAFMGCQGQTSLTQIFSESNIWTEASFPETFTYSMYKYGEEASMGTLTMKVEKLNASTTYYLGKDGLTDADNQIYSVTTASGNATYMTTTTLEATNYSQTSIALFANNYKMLATYSKIVDNKVETSFVAHNVDNKRYYYKTNADWSKEYAIKNGKYISAPYFDNTMIYYVARSIPNDSSYATFSFNIFDHETNKKEKVTLTHSGDTATTVPVGEEALSCRTINMTTSDALLGKTNNITCFVTYAPYKGYKQVITKIIEGNYIYVLNA